MILVPFALALPPAVCPPGLFPARDGRCTGAETPWRLDEVGGGTLFVAPDGTVALVGAGSVVEQSFRPVDTVRVDPRDGAVSSLPAPFDGQWADVELQLADGRIVALRGPDPEAPGEVGVAWLERDHWRVGPKPPPQSLRGAATRVEAEGSVLFVGGGGPGTATKKTAWRWFPETDRWVSLPALPVGRGWATLLPGPAGPVVCGGVATVERDAAIVPGCLTLVGRTWSPAPVGIPLGADSEGVSVGDGVVAFDHGATEQAWWVSAAGGVTPLPTPPKVSRWVGGAGPRLTGLDAEGHLCWLTPATGAVETWVAPGDARGWGGAAVALDDRRALYVGALTGDTFGAGVVDAAHPSLAGHESDMFTDAGQTDGTIVRADDGVVSVWDPVRRQFSALPPLPEPRTAAAVVPLPDGRVLVAGGRNRDTPSAGVWVGDGAGWVARAPLPAPLTDATGLHLPNGRVLVAGTLDRSGGASFLYDPATDTWSPQPLPEPAPGRLVALAGGAAWVRDESYRQPRAAVAVWTPTGWRAVDPVPGVTTGVAFTGLADGSLVAAGGRTEADYGGVDAAWRLAPDTSHWTPLPPLTRDRWGGALVALAPDRLLLVGGEAPAELFDGTRWVQAAPLDIERRDPHVFALDPTTALVLGGFTEEDGPDWELYRVLGAPTDFPDPVLPDPRLVGHPDAVALGHHLVAAEVGCSAGDAEACRAAAALWEAAPLADPAKAADRRARACRLRGEETCP